MLNNGTVVYFQITDTDIGNAVMAYCIAKDTQYSCLLMLLHNHTNLMYTKRSPGFTEACRSLAVRFQLIRQKADSLE